MKQAVTVRELSIFPDEHMTVSLREPFDVGLHLRNVDARSVDEVAKRFRASSGHSNVAGKSIDSSIEALPSLKFFDEAACKDSKDIFIGHERDSKKTRQAIECAKSVCMLCPVKIDCLSFGRSTVDKDDNPYAIYGGMTVAEILDES